MILDLVSEDDPILRQTFEDFDFSNPPTDPIELANNLIETMADKKGLGLSACQVGLPYRVFVLWSETPLVVFNPRVVDQKNEFVVLEEGCLSFPGLFIKVKRPSMVKVRYQDARGETHTQTFIGMTARTFLHEMDHLDGILYTQRANKIHLSRAYNQRKVLQRKLKRGEVYYKPTEMPTAEQVVNQQTKKPGTVTDGVFEYKV